MDKAVHVPGFFFGDVILDVKTFYFTRKLTGKVACIKLRDEINARLSREQVFPRLRNSVAHGADTTQTCHDDTTTTHSLILKKT